MSAARAKVPHDDDPGGRGRAGDPRAPQGQPRRMPATRCRRAVDAETAQCACSRTRCPTCSCSTGCCPASPAWRSPGALRADARTKELPVIMVTARTDEADKVAGLEAWVDDYVTKPFSPRELKARIKAVLRRRAPEAAQEPLAAGDLRLDPVTHRVTADDAPVALGPDRVPPAALPARASRARAFAHAAARPGVGRPRLHRGAHGRRAHPPAAAGARALRASTASSRRCAAPATGSLPRATARCGARARCCCKALAAPAAVLAAASWSRRRGGRWALGVLALGWGAIIVHHVAAPRSPHALGGEAARAPVPEGSGVWRARLLRASTGGCARAARTSATSRTPSSASRARPRRFPTAWWCSTAHNRIKWANLRAQALLGLDARQDIGAPLVNLVRTPAFVRYLEAATIATACSSIRSATPRSRWRSRSCRSAWPRSCSSPATSRRSRRWRGCGATSSPTSRTS